MRRSLCPSVFKREVLKDISNNNNNNASNSNNSLLSFKTNNNDNNNNNNNSGDLVITRKPFLVGLQVPESDLNKRFTIPSGCKNTRKSAELRKFKSLGPNRSKFIPVRPGEYQACLPKSLNQENGMVEDDEEDEDNELCDLPTSLPPHEPLILWSDPNDIDHKIQVIPELCCKLRPHQREGVQFLFECTMGLRRFEGNGCILADDMGLGKTFMSITLLWTLMAQGFEKGESAVRKAIVACPTSLVGNWENEIKRWVGDKCTTFPVKSDPKIIIRNYLQYKGKAVLIVSYDTQRRYTKMFGEKSKMNYGCSCDLLICDEAHKLKNAENQISKSLFSLPAKKRILLSGTPMQNELTEFFNMVNFCNPGVLGTIMDFRKKYERPILRAKELDAEKKDKDKADILQKELSIIVNEFILKRGNILNAKHLPPKLVQIVCCRLSPLQSLLYDHMLNSKEIKSIMNGKQKDTLGVIRNMMSICNHPQLIVESYKKKVEEKIDDPELAALVKIVKDYLENNVKMSSNTSNNVKQNGPNKDNFIDPLLSGKMLVLYRLMQTMRALKNGEKIVIVSNYTATLDLIEKMCINNLWPVLRLDGSTNGQHRTERVEKFNLSNGNNTFAFLLSSKAGGCGINLIGGNRLVLFDPDWNPANDKQAAGRIWREGQERRCFIYRFMSTGTIEEKIIQRQLSKQSLQSVVDDEEDANKFSTSELKALFEQRSCTICNTHDVLRCKRCTTVNKLDTANKVKEMNNKQCKECFEFVTEFLQFLKENSTSTFESEELGRICTELESGSMKLSLPLFSRKLRETVNAIESDIVEGNSTVFESGFSVMNEFVNRWTDFAVKLAGLKDECASVQQKKNDDNDEDDEEVENVEQEGCPEENDLNSWSHHSNLSTCDDETLRKALLDDNTISFVFGLEVNWSLLQAKVEESKTLEEVKKQKKIEEANQYFNNKRHKEDESKVVSKKSEKVKKKKTDMVDNDMIDNPFVDNDLIDNPMVDNDMVDNDIVDNDGVHIAAIDMSLRKKEKNTALKKRRSQCSDDDEEDISPTDTTTTTNTTIPEKIQNKTKSLSKKSKIEPVDYDDDEIDFENDKITTLKTLANTDNNPNPNPITKKIKRCIESDDDEDRIPPTDCNNSKSKTAEKSQGRKTSVGPTTLLSLSKPPSKEKESSSGSNNSNSNDEDVDNIGWTCLDCTYIETVCSYECTFCSAPRPGYKRLPKRKASSK